jgi:hypothetical protein
MVHGTVIILRGDLLSKKIMHGDQLEYANRWDY